jgi:hypothetical protein
VVRIKDNETLLAVLIFFTIVIVVGLGDIWIGVIVQNIFLFYTILLGTALFIIVYALSHVLSGLAAEKRLLVRIVSWTILAPLSFSLTLFTLVYVFGPIERGRIMVEIPGTMMWSQAVPKDALWTWPGLFPLNIFMLAIWLVGVLTSTVQEEPSILAYAVARAEKKRIITLYVKSVRTEEEIDTSGRESEISGTLGPHYYEGTPMGDGDLIRVDKFVFPEDQEELISMVEEMARDQGFAVRVVDLAKEETHERVDVIPTLVADSGRRLEGGISEKQLESFLAQVKTEPARSN